MNNRTLKTQDNLIMNIHSSLIILAACTLASMAPAEVKLNALFSDNAVLQQGANVPVVTVRK